MMVVPVFLTNIKISRKVKLLQGKKNFSHCYGFTENKFSIRNSLFSLKQIAFIFPRQDL